MCSNTSRRPATKHPKGSSMLQVSTLEKRYPDRGIHMRRLAINGLCAIALLSGCAKPGVPDVAQGGGSDPPVHLPCPGKNVPVPATKVSGMGKTTVHWVVNGTCKLKKFIFVGQGQDPPPGFEQKTYPPGASVDYEYDGTTPILAPYLFIYVNDDPTDGNGSGIIK